MNAIILEDNTVLRNQLKELVHKYFPQITFIGEGSTIEEGFDLISNTNNVELLFLDVELKDGTSFELLAQIEYHKYKVVFITSFDKYAVKAFRYSAIDYLLKPVNEQELQDCLEKVLLASLEETKAIEVFLHNQKANKENKKVTLQNSDGIYVTNIKDIIHIEAYGNYTKVHVTYQKLPLVISKTLKEFEKLFSQDGFLRTHHGHMININHVRKLVSKDGGYLIMTNDREIPISQRKKSDVMTQIEAI